MGSMTTFGPFVKCAVGIHILYGVYAITQEYLTTHTFEGKLFKYPVFLVFHGQLSGLILVHRLNCVQISTFLKTFWGQWAHRVQWSKEPNGPKWPNGSNGPTWAQWVPRAQWAHRAQWAQMAQMDPKGLMGPGPVPGT